MIDRMLRKELQFYYQYNTVEYNGTVHGNGTVQYSGMVQYNGNVFVQMVEWLSIQFNIVHFNNI